MDVACFTNLTRDHLDYHGTLQAYPDTLVGTDSHTTMVNGLGVLGWGAGGIEAETRQTMENIKRTVEAVGSSMDKVVKCTVMMADMAEWDRMNVVYREFFPATRLPARSAFGASGLALNARVEIECIATR